jgi:hypothetical protein
VREGSLVRLSNRQLKFDFEQLGSMVGILLERQARSDARGFSGPVGWLVLWPDGIRLMYEIDVDVVQDA